MVDGVRSEIPVDGEQLQQALRHAVYLLIQKAMASHDPRQTHIAALCELVVNSDESLAVCKVVARRGS